MPRRLVACLISIGAALAVSSAALQAQGNYPDRPIRVVVPFPPGTSPDIALRIMTPRLSELLGQSFVVENRPGAAGDVGAAQVASASPDGYTLLYTINSIICANPHLYSKLTFDPLKSFVPVSMVANLGYVLLGRPDLPARTLSEMLALAKAEPGKLTYGSAGLGSGNHIVMELVNRMAGTRMVHVPMAGTSSTVATLAGHIDLTMSPYTTGVPGAKDGTYRVYGVTLAKRPPAIPEVPAIGETLPGFVGDAWHAIFATAGTPQPVVDRLSREIGRVLSEPEIKAKFTTVSLEPLPTTPAELGRISRADHEKWGKIIREAGIKIN